MFPDYHDPYLVTLIQAEVINTFGNLLGRATGIVNPKQVFPTSKTVSKFETAASKKIEADLRALPSVCAGHYSTGNFSRGVEEIMRITRSVNNLFQEVKPWALIKLRGQEEKVEWIIYVTLESLRIMSILLQPIIPETASRSLDRLGIHPSLRMWSHANYTKEKLVQTPLGANTKVIFPKVK